MAAAAPTHLYSHAVQRATATTVSVSGAFSAPKTVEVVAAQGTRLSLLRPNADGTVAAVSSTEVFGTVRSLCTFRLAGASCDYLVVGSDSGRIAILEYDSKRQDFVRVHQETFGRPGCRRVVPGQLVASDPRGRAVMIAALEKQKIVYILSRDAEARLTISSPLEAHRSGTITSCLCGLDDGFNNPVFAALETDFTDADELLANRPSLQTDQASAAAAVMPIRQKVLTLYELDLGTNHVTRVSSEPVETNANLLVAVPGGGDGPGGVLILCEDAVQYRNPLGAAGAGREAAAAAAAATLRATLPRRKGLPAHRGTLLTCAAAHKQKSLFFVLAQSEYGDLYKISLSMDAAGVPARLVVKHFDTIPPCVSMHVLKTGFLFASSEYGDHGLYQFQGMGDGDDGDACATSDDAQAGRDAAARRASAKQLATRPLRNLYLTHTLESHAPIIAMRAANLLGEEVPQLYALCGQGVQSQLKVLRAGLSVTTHAENELPDTAKGVWTLKERRADDFDTFIIVSLAARTLVMRVGESVEEVQESDTSFILNVSTLHVALLGDDTHVQVHAGGVRLITGDKRINEWRAPGRRSITHAASNMAQLIVALSGGTLVYFELGADGMLQSQFEKSLEVTGTGGAQSGGDVACLTLAPVQAGQLRANFAAVGGYDNTVRVLNLPVDVDESLTVAAIQAVLASPSSLLMIDFGGNSGLSLCIGLSNGVLVRCEVDATAGTLSDSSNRFLGGLAARLCEVSCASGPAVLALSSRTYLGYHREDGARAGGGGTSGGTVFMPVSCPSLVHASPFAFASSGTAIVAVESNVLRIFGIDDIGERFHAKGCRINYTGRAMCFMNDHRTVVVGCADSGVEPIGPNRDEGADDAEDPLAFRALVGPTRTAVAGSWASCVQIVDPRRGSVLFTLELNGASGSLIPDPQERTAGFESVTAVCSVTFPEHRGNETLVAVATARNLQYLPRRTHEGGYIHIFAYRRTRVEAEDTHALELVHTTRVKDEVPMCMCAFQGKLLVGVGGILRLYDLGLKRLLRKCEVGGFGTIVKSIEAYGSRVYAADVCESVFIIKYRSAENVLYVVANDVLPRHMTACRRLDYDTVAGADKFGNAFILRLNEEASVDIDDDPTGGLSDKQHQLDTAAHIHLGDMVTALDVATLQPGGEEVVLGATVSGAIRALVPFATNADADFFLNLELHLRQELPPLCGRDHMEFRGCYAPVRHVIDGDLIESYASLPADTQDEIAQALDRTRGDVLKRIEAIKNRVV